jgi:hypothetical protein
VAECEVVDDDDDAAAAAAVVVVDVVSEMESVARGGGADSVSE